MKFSQAPSSVLMVRPGSFGFNSQTAASNAFQSDHSESAEEISNRALMEFDRMVSTLKAHDVDVIIANDLAATHKPDAIFPNNWISFHPDGRVILYPMMAENRRLERDSTVIDLVKSKFQVTQILDFSNREKENQFLEGTGSVVFDYPNRIAYACRSVRTHEEVFQDLCRELGYHGVLFNAVDESGHPIYHTNVLMCVGTNVVVICLDAIKSDDDQENLLSSFARTDHRVVAISYDQLRSFAGNMIEVLTKSGEPVMLISQKAFKSLLPGQIDAISKQSIMLPLKIETIEQYGGGSVRCMVAGLFNKKL